MKAKSDKSNPGKGPKEEKRKMPKNCIEVTNQATGLRELVPGTTVSRVSEAAPLVEGEPTNAIITQKLVDAGPGVTIRTQESYDDVLELIREQD